ncbi:MAG TPA: SDR family NAD(P)-dependent oxidoreductase [Terriglobales bacterium]|jgi:NAD(P)-dependent dehydrogenase (short-subunit alcohol dehydrogenase family)|nr:SDR family NAD(P)-dependent oxidoreductase [Terriglobales bacterium]
MPIPPPKELLNFHGQVVVVTGASSGIGAGIATRFAEAGANVVVNYRANQKGAEAVAKSVKKSGRRGLVVQADVSQSSGATALMEQAADAFGAIDVLVNNAGVYPASALLEMSELGWDEVIAANLRSVHLCTQAAARVMIALRRPGAIVNIASIEASNPAPQHSHYSAAKAAVVMYTRSAALELGGKGIRVNCVSPGLIWREGLERDWPEGVDAYLRAVPLGRLGKPDDVADACLFLASTAARWITGANLLVDGGILTNRAY